MLLACFCHMFLECFWYVFGTFLVRFWYVFGMFLVCFWYVFGMFGNELCDRSSLIALNTHLHGLAVVLHSFPISL
jgi:hypothetical protein